MWKHLRDQESVVSPVSLRDVYITDTLAGGGLKYDGTPSPDTHARTPFQSLLGVTSPCDTYSRCVVLAYLTWFPGVGVGDTSLVAFWKFVSRVRGFTVPAVVPTSSLTLWVEKRVWFGIGSLSGAPLGHALPPETSASDGSPNTGVLPQDEGPLYLGQRMSSKTRSTRPSRSTVVSSEL